MGGLRSSVPVCGGLFLEGSAAEQREIDGLMFPKVLLPATSEQEGDLAAVVRAVGEGKGWIGQELHRHGAILMRGFGVRSSLDFEAFMEALGWQTMSYVGVAQRTQLHPRVFTANESSLETEIYFHHEMSYSPFFPSKVIFFCELEPGEGANTPIILSRKVTESVSKSYPDFFEKLEEKGVTYTIPMKSRQGYESFLRGWEDFFETIDKDEAERRAINYTSRLEWGPNRSTTIIQGPVPAVTSYKEHPKDKVWRNIITGIYVEPDKDKGNGNVTFGDGSPLPKEAVEGCKRILEEWAVDIPWQRGDIMILDNLAVMHGRRVGKPPRKILASLVPYDP